MRILLLLASLVSLTACPSAGESRYHCDFVNATTGQEDRCQERSVDPLIGATSEQTFLDTCDVSQGVSGSGPCPTDGIVGGCLYDDNGGLETVTDWYYAPMTLADVEAECAGEGTVVQP
ncbi:MAG: hypothetical protein KDA24_20720 [Deltaproteobacteria bacterium]|nr:hypothetical protein [Deltaproteobacteria bacterium]